MKNKIYLLIVAGGLGFPVLSVADATDAPSRFALGVKAGTLGAGFEGTFGISERFNVRAGINNYSRKFEDTESDIRYDATLDLKNAGVFLDWHPFAGTFRLSAGLINNRNGIHLSATPTANQQIGSTTYTPAQIGTLTGDVTFKKNAPYLGIGWGNAVNKGSPFGFNFELGVAKQGSPKVKLTSSNSTVSQSDLDSEARSAETDLGDFKSYPVISLGLSYRF